LRKELYSTPAHDLIGMIETQEITVEELVSAILDRINAMEKDIHAYITVTASEALKKAREIDAKLKRNQPVGKLKGIPIAIKDNICTEGVRTTCGSKMLENYYPPYDATVVKRIKDADGIIVGKTNMDEFAIGV